MAFYKVHFGFREPYKVRGPGGRMAAAAAAADRLKQHLQQRQHFALPLAANRQRAALQAVHCSRLTYLLY